MTGFAVVYRLSLALCIVPMGLCPSVAAAGEYQLEIEIESARRRVYVKGASGIDDSIAPKLVRRELAFQITPYARNLLFGTDESNVHERPRCRQDGGDLTCTISLKTVRAPRQLYFSYDLEGAEAPQLRVTDKQVFAGGGGELWYPQIRFSEKDTGEIRCIVPDGWHCFATGTDKGRAKKGARTVFSSQVSRPAKFAFAAAKFCIYDDGRLGLLTLSSRSDAQGRTRLASRVLELLESQFGTLPYSHLLLDDNEAEPGAIVLQGEENRVEFRNITISEPVARTPRS